MSLRGIIESTIHVEHFRNVDLFNQGFYSLKLKLFHFQGEEKVYSYPIEINLSDTAQKKRDYVKESSKAHDLTDASEGFLDDDDKSFNTRSFVIRYFDEEVEINDLCTFRSEIEVQDGFLNADFYIEAELYYIELKSMGNGKLPDKIKTVNETFPLQSVSQAKFKVKRFGQGVSEYFPIVFEGAYFCQFDLTLHSCLIDMRFRPFKMGAAGLEVTPESEANFFFKDQNGEIPSELNYRKVDKVYNDYINIFSHMYDRMTGKFKRYVNECLEDEQRDLLEDRITVPPLKHPGDENSKKEEQDGSPAGGNLSKNTNLKAFIVQPKSPNDLLDDSDHEYGIETNENLSEEKVKVSVPVLKNRQKNFMNKNIIPFSERHMLTDPVKIAKKIVEELCYVSLQLCDLWNRINEVIRIEPKFVLEFLKVDYDQKIREKWCDGIFRKIILTEDFTEHTEENFESLHKDFLIKRLENGYSDNIDQLAIQDENLWAKPDLHPILIEHCYQKRNYSPIDIEADTAIELDCPYEGYYKGCHMIVFVHGFQGSCTDMKILKNYFSMIHPEAVFLLSEANHNNTENCLEDMGEKLADEVSKKIESYCPGTSLGRLSFIGHSMGGIIIRAALPHLEKYKDKMFTYISLSTPHLGYMYNSSKIISTGMWFLKQWKKSRSLSQLSMTDSKTLDDSFLYKLSCYEGLNWFKNIVLVSSFKDSYAPFDSARIQNCSQATKDMKNGELYIKMADNILSKLIANCIYRIDTNFMISEKTIDTFIGRAAHIHFLENVYFMRILSQRFYEFFD